VRIRMVRSRPNHDGERTFHRAADVTSAPMGSSPSMTAGPGPISVKYRYIAGYVRNDPRSSFFICAHLCSCFFGSSKGGSFVGPRTAGEASRKAEHRCAQIKNDARRWPMPRSCLGSNRSFRLCGRSPGDGEFCPRLPLQPAFIQSSSPGLAQGQARSCRVMTIVVCQLVCF
jgi:hypothetical protein